MIGFQPKPEHDLYSETLAPVEHSKRTISSLGLGIIWFGIAVQVTGFVIMTPLVKYYTIGELVAINFIGQFLVAVACFFTQEIGLKYGVSFATSISAAAGTIGGKFVGLIRALPSIAFIGFNGFVGATAINMITSSLFGFDNMTVALTLNAALLIIVTLGGAKRLEKFTSFAAPLMIVIGFAMFYSVMKHHAVSILDIWNLGVTEGPKSWLYGIGICLGGFGATAMGFNDFTKEARIKNGNLKKAAKNHFLSYSLISSPAFMFFTVIGCIPMVLVPGMTGAKVLPYMTEVLTGNNPYLIALVGLFVFVAQLSTNSAANIYSSVYVISSLVPKYVDYKKATIGVVVAAFLIAPWKLGSSIDFLLALFGAAAGPALGMIAVDYFYFRKRKLSLGDLYTTKGKYYYWGGFNFTALIPYVAGIAAAMAFLDYNYFVGISVTSILYIILGTMAGKKYPSMFTETAPDITDFSSGTDTARNGDATIAM